MASLARIASEAPELDCMRKQADSDRNLLQFYNLSLPLYGQLADNQVTDSSTRR